MVSKRFVALTAVLLLLSSSFMLPLCSAQIVDSEWADAIDAYCYEVDYDTSAEIVVCVFPSLTGHGITDGSGKEITDIVKLGVYVFNDLPLDVADGTQTGIGKKGKDNGVLVLVALEERQWRIEVGYGLEADITDIESNLIAQQYLVPAFKSADYGEGLYDTVVALGAQIPVTNQTLTDPLRGYYFYESTDTPASTPTPFWLLDIYGLPLWLVIVLLVLGVALPVFGGRARGGGRSGGGGAGGKW
ncbi:MAG: TPM domain-containing protein [Candidatus Bathyarchaeota archaeon]|nr:TPM domain-containing protein [Candidatus Bathyarchaeota archaeon]